MGVACVVAVVSHQRFYGNLVRLSFAKISRHPLVLISSEYSLAEKPERFRPVLVKKMGSQHNVEGVAEEDTTTRELDIVELAILCYELEGGSLEGGLEVSEDVSPSLSEG